MNYFISENAFEFNSGTEFSQAARTSMYNSFGNLTLFVTRNYTPVFHRTIKTLGLNDHQVLNMYDFSKRRRGLAESNKIYANLSQFLKKDTSLKVLIPTNH